MIDEKFYTRTAVTHINDLLLIDEISCLIGDISHLSQDTLAAPILHIAVLKDAEHGQISFFDNPKYKQNFFDSKAQFCIAKPDFIQKAPQTMAVIPSSDPYRLYALVAKHLYEDHTLKTDHKEAYIPDSFGAMVHKDAVLEDHVQTAHGVVIEAGVHIGAYTIIQPNSYIGYGCHIGRNCLIQSNVSISNALIGDHVHLFSGTRVGQDGFGFAMGKTHQKVPQLGRVIIQDHVSIGANSCIDRGTIKDTIIGEGTCIDNMVQIAHNVVMGTHCVVAGNSSIAGSVTFGHYVVCGGHSCIAGHLTIQDQARISGGAAVMRNIKAKQTVAGNPAFEVKNYFRSLATLKKLANKE